MKCDVQNSGVPPQWTCISNNSVIQFHLADIRTLRTRIYCTINQNLDAEITSADRKRTHSLLDRITNFATLETTLRELSRIQVCDGTGLEDENHGRSSTCHVIVTPDQASKNNHSPYQRCHPCRAYRLRYPKNENQREKRKAKLAEKKSRKERSQRYHLKKMKTKIEGLQREVDEAQRACAASSEEAVEKDILRLAPSMQETVRACLAASKVNDSRQRRYTTEWIYHCILFRIKSKALYEHMRRSSILALPCHDTLNRYLKTMQCGYGFQQPVSECLKLKSSGMMPASRRGTLLIDEMKLSENISFDESTMTFKGYTDLGEHTPENKKNLVGDHALVIMFQPFQGGWVQTVGCFLSNGSASGESLHRLIIDATAMIENAGFFVDAITTDGATWNRAMWKKFNIDENNPSCSHPMNDERKLWFLSDFPHLIKTLRNWVINRENFETPDGRVDLEHWRQVLRTEQPSLPALRIAYMLSWDHLHPLGYEKMNVAMAFQLFCPQIQTAMSMHAANSLPSISFCKRVNDLIIAMMSRTPAGALRQNSAHREAITDFLEYLKEWERLYQVMNPSLQCLTAPTLLGLKVTLHSTLEIFKYLQEEHRYKYLMTSRLNQDSLEKFFGLIRAACGCDDHPDATHFAYIYRLLSVYSLITPPKNSNISGSEMLETLVNAKDVSNGAKSTAKVEWLESLDLGLKNIEFVEINNNHMDNRHSSYHSLLDHDYCALNTRCGEMDVHVEKESHHSNSSNSDHNYHLINTSDHVQSYIAGYIARKMGRLSECPLCFQEMTSMYPEKRDRVIQQLSKGYLLYPSEKLFNVTKIMEKIVLEEVCNNPIQYDTILRIADRVAGVISDSAEFQLVDCQEHCRVLTKKIINSYVVLPGHFLAKFMKKSTSDKKRKMKKLRKQVKLN